MGDLLVKMQEIQCEAMAEIYDFWVYQENGIGYEGIFEQHERLTSFSEPITYGGYVYQPTTIKRTQVKQDDGFKDQSITVSANLTPLFSSYIANYPVMPINVLIRKVLVSDPNNFVITILRGRVKAFSLKDQQVSVQCIGGSSIFGRKCPPYIYQSYCNHQLFDDRCGVDANSYYRELSKNDNSWNGSELTNADLAGDAAGYWTGGQIFDDGLLDKRIVTYHSGSMLRVNVPFPYADSGWYIVVAGCDKSPATCKTKFNNFDNFLGFPYIPNNNPVVFGLK